MLYFCHKAFKYQEDFTNAITGYSMASQLDPEWTQPNIELEDLKKRLRMTVELIEKKVEM